MRTKQKEIAVNDKGEGSFRTAANRDGTLAGATAAGDDDADDDEGWLNTRLKFVRHIDDSLRGFAPATDDYVTVDPLAAGGADGEKKKTLSELKTSRDRDGRSDRGRRGGDRHRDRDSNRSHGLGRDRGRGRDRDRGRSRRR